MYFINIDDKEQCIGFFCSGALSFETPNYETLSKTWKYTSSLREQDHIEYAWLYVGGKSVEEICPPALREAWDIVSEKMHAFKKSLAIAKVDTCETCLFDLVPEKFISQFLDIKTRITKSVFQTVEKPKNYDHLLSIAKMIEDIKYRKVNIDTLFMRNESYKQKVRNFIKDMKRTDSAVFYKLFGTKTGRLATNKKSFPILSLDKDLRKFVRPNNNLFVEIDFNAAELRTLLALSGKEQPKEDIHEWNTKNLFQGLTTREEAKKRIFSWLYNPASEDYLLDRTYDRDFIKERYWDGLKVTTPFFREIESDEYHSVNYILQSTTSDLFLEQAFKIYELLESKKSNIAFLMHDSIILDFDADEKSMVSEIIRKFQDTRFGKYKVNVKIGTNFGSMREINWKR